MDDSKPLLVDTGRGFSIQYQGRWLYSQHDPARSPLAAVMATPMKQETLYVVPSPCLCHGLGILLEQLPESSAVLCIEAETRLLTLAAPIITDKFPGIMISTPRDAIATYRILEKKMTPVRFRRVIEISLSGGRALHHVEYDNTLAAIDADIQVRFRNRLALVRMGRLWTKNIISNLGAMQWNSIKPVCSDDKPVVVCGAGPSLDSALPVLSAHRNGLFILACDTASGALAQAGVVPDAIACLEGQVYNVGDFLPLDGKSTTLIVDLTAHPSSYRALQGSLSLTLSEYTNSAFLTRLAASGLPITLVPPLGSVGVFAIRIARLLGEPILVAGLDFAFNQGQTHCSGSPADLHARRTESRTEKRNTAWSNSFRDGCTRRPDGSLTDPTLSMYAALAAGELQGLGAGDLRNGFGADLPLQRISSMDLAALDGSKNRTGGAKSIRLKKLGTKVDAKTCRKRAVDFLKGELRRAEDVASALHTGTTGERLRALLVDADFLYCHFPDPERVLALENDALKRVAAEAAYWRGRIEAALT